MSDDSVDPRWADLLSLAAHEIRNPLGAAAGYVRMLLSGRVGDVSGKQRQLLEETAKICGRISDVLHELSALSDLEDGTARFDRRVVNLGSLLDESVAALPADPDRTIALDVTSNGAGTLQGDPMRLKSAFASVIHAVRREVVTSNRLCVHERARTIDGRRVGWVAVADPDRVEWLATAAPDSLVTFDEWRGGCGLSLPVARRVIAAHGGHIWSPPGDAGGRTAAKAAAAIALPLA